MKLYIVSEAQSIPDNSKNPLVPFSKVYRTEKKAIEGLRNSFLKEVVESSLGFDDEELVEKTVKKILKGVRTICGIRLYEWKGEDRSASWRLEEIRV